jgi:PAS domain S-box-containing protein
MLRSLSDPIATAIERLRLNRQTEKRAAEMETVAMVSSAVTTLMEVDSLLEAVANLTKDSFNLYHAHIYLLDEDNLVVAGGAGEPGRMMKEQRRTIPLNHPHSIVASVGRTQLGVIANDVTQNPDFLPHPLLPETKSEMAIPLLIGDEIIGVLDVQASAVNRFTDDDVRVMSTLASQIAVAVQNARAFESVQKAETIVRDTAGRLSQAATIARLGHWELDVETQLFTFTDEFYAIFRTTAEREGGYQMEPMTYAQKFVHPDDMAAVGPEIQKALAGETTTQTELEHRIIYADGEIGTIVVRFNAIKDASGRTVKMVGANQDITERKRQEEAMRENQAQLAEAQRIARLGRWSWNLATNDIIWNDQMFEFNGISPDTAMNFEVFSSTLHPEDAPGLMSGIQGLLQSGDQNTWPEYRIIRPTGEIRYLTATGTVKRDAQGNPYEMVGIVQDITEAKRIQQERQILFEAASKLNDARSPQDVMEAVNNYARDMGCISATLMYVDSDENNQAEWASVVANWAAEGSIATEIGMRFYLPEFPFARLWTAQTDKPTLIDDIVTNSLVDEATRSLMMQFGIRGLALLPLYTQGRWVALMSFSWGEAAEFNERDIRIFTSMAQQATSAVDALRLAEATRQARDEAEILYSISNQLTTARTLDELLTATSRYAQGKNVYSASLMYIDTDKDNQPEWAEIVAAWEAEGAVTAPVGTRFYLPELPFAKLWTANPHDVTLLGDAMNTDAMDEGTRELFKQFGIAGIALLPLYAKGGWIGLLSFTWGTTTTFTDQDHRVFSSIMRQTTSVVDAMRSSALTRKRALELATVAQVSAAATTILDVEPLLQQVSDLTKLSFNLYHAHIYLLENNTLVLTAGAGEVGRTMREQGRSISFNQANSLVARAARERKGIIVNDVTQNPDFLPNPLLPDTKSEMAIPMLVGEQLVGVLDVQGDIVNRFSDEDVQIMSTLAAQVAVAVRNARAFELERQTAERLREVDRLKSQFLANMSHELRTPLNSIIGYSEVLLDGGDGDLSEEAVEDVETIHGSGQHLLAIINDILDLAKIEAGQMQINRQDADLTKFLTEIVHAGQILVKDKPVTLTLVEEAELPHVHADPIRLRQIVWNLVSNAVKFTEKGDVTVTVGLLDEKQAYVKVTDSGIGIKAEDVGVVFDQFRQVDGSSTRRAGGTGLGLTITRHLVRLHGGDIFVESEFGVGSTFWFSLPLYARVNN